MSDLRLRFSVEKNFRSILTGNYKERAQVVTGLGAWLIISWLIIHWVIIAWLIGDRDFSSGVR